MPEYIEREALIKRIRLLPRFAPHNTVSYSSVQRAIFDAPKADVVECLKWISVKEKLPEENVRVLVWLKENDSYTRIDTDRLTRSSVTFWVRWGKYVTHWCPIPESLKEGAEE